MTWTENWTAGPSVVGTTCARGVGQGPEIVCTLVGLTTTLGPPQLAESQPEGKEGLGPAGEERSTLVFIKH